SPQECGRPVRRGPWADPLPRGGRGRLGAQVRALALTTGLTYYQAALRGDPPLPAGIDRMDMRTFLMLYESQRPRPPGMRPDEGSGGGSAGGGCARGLRGGLAGLEGQAALRRATISNFPQAVIPQSLNPISRPLSRAREARDISRRVPNGELLDGHPPAT